MTVQYENFTRLCSNHSFTEESYMEIRNAFDKKLPNGLCWRVIKDAITWSQKKEVTLTPSLLTKFLLSRV